MLSCEQLFMRYLDAQMAGSTAELFAHLTADLRAVTAVRLTETSWLTRDDFHQEIRPVLDAFAARGGAIER